VTNNFQIGKELKMIFMEYESVTQKVILYTESTLQDAK
jgi:archaellum component FlaC